MNSETKLQRDYYTRTAGIYDAMHVTGNGEHDLACALIASFAKYYDYRSILDLGSGTGRAVANLTAALPHCKIVGVEPVEALREVGYSRGITAECLVSGDATRLDFADESFDLVVELGVLHHLPKPRLAVEEMLRVARKAIFISDVNRFAQGPWLSRATKMLLWRIGAWPMANWIKTRGRGYSYSEGDGIGYSYSVFDDYDHIKSACREITVVNLNGAPRNFVMEASHVGLLARKS